MSQNPPSPPFPLPPSWTDPGSITSYLVALATFVISLLTFAGVTLPAGTTSTVQAWAGVLGLAIAAGVMVFNIVTHRKLVAAYIGAVAMLQPSATQSGYLTTELLQIEPRPVDLTDSAIARLAAAVNDQVLEFNDEEMKRIGDAVQPVLDVGLARLCEAIETAMERAKQ